MKTANRIRLRLEELEGRLVPSTLTYSSNWAGYAVASGAGTVSQVAGQWVVPTVSTNVSGYSSAWVGIDGYNSNSVEQIGTDSDYVNGQAQYYAWYEMYPNPSINISLTVQPGDTISASVSFTSPNLFALAITNVTTGNSFSISQTSSSAQRSSAEWIQEAPSSLAGILPLANFGTINFSGANATVNGTSGLADNAWSGSTLYQIDMSGRHGALKATTSALSDAASPAPSSFSVTWVSSGASSGSGGHHKSTNAPLPEPSQTISAPSVGTVTAASVQGASSVFVVPTSPIAAAVPATATDLSAQPALVAVPATSVQFSADAANGADDAHLPNAPLPGSGAVPIRPAVTSPSDAPAAPAADPAPANVPGATMELNQAPVAAIAQVFGLPAASLEGVASSVGAFGQGQGIALASLLLTFALDHGWVTAVREQAAKRDGARERAVQPELRHA